MSMRDFWVTVFDEDGRRFQTKIEAHNLDRARDTGIAAIMAQWSEVEDGPFNPMPNVIVSETAPWESDDPKMLTIRVRYITGEISEQAYLRTLAPYGTLVRRAINQSMRFTEETPERIFSVEAR